MGRTNSNGCSFILESEQKAKKNTISFNMLRNTKRIIKAAGAKLNLTAGFEHQAQLKVKIMNVSLQISSVENIQIASFENEN